MLQSENITIKEMRHTLIEAEKKKYAGRKNGELSLKIAVESWQRMSDELIKQWYNAFFITIEN